MLYNLKSRAISLVELMVTIAVLGILAGGSVYVVKNQTTNAYVVDGLAQMDSLESAVRAFYATYSCLPGDCVVNSVTSLPAGIVINSGNQDGIVNNWYSSTVAPAIGYAGFEDVNAIQHLVATGLITALPNGNINTVVASSGALTASTGLGLPTVFNASFTTSASSNILYQNYSKYYVRGKSPNIYYGVRSVYANSTATQSILPYFSGIYNASGTLGSGANVNFIVSVVATYANPVTATIDNMSYNIMAGMDKKADGDTPTSGQTQAILMAVGSNGNVSTASVVPLAFGATNGTIGIVSACTNSTGATNPITGIGYAQFSGPGGLLYSSFSGSWSNVVSSQFNTAPFSGTYNTNFTSLNYQTNLIVSVDLVRPIYGLN